MTITCKYAALELLYGYFYIRLPILGEVFIDFTGRQPWQWDR